MGLFSKAKASPAAPTANVPTPQAQSTSKSREEKDARARGFNNGAMVGTLIGGPVVGYIGGKIGAAHMAKKEREDFERGGHEPTEDTMGAKAKRMAKGAGGMLLRGGG